MRSVVVRSLVMALVPLLIVATPQGAQAATTYGDESHASWVMMQAEDPTRPVGAAEDFKCNGVAYWVVEEDEAYINVKGTCSVSWAAELDVWRLKSLLFTGDGCNVLGVTEADPESEWSGVAGITSGEEPCVIDTVIVNACQTAWTGDDCATASVPWHIVPPFVDEAASCQYGDPAKPTHGNQRNDWIVKVEDFTFAINNPAAGTQADDWMFYTVHAVPPGEIDYNGISFWREVPALSGRALVAGQSLTFPMQPWSRTFSGWVAGRSDNPNGQMLYPTIGMGIVYWPAVQERDQWNEGSVAQGMVRLPQENIVGYPGLAGVTDSSICAFYWGVKIAEQPNTDTDEPLGPLDVEDTGGGTTEPDPVVDPPPDEGCGWNWTDPSTWGASGWCLLGGLLNQILGVLKSIFGVLGSLVTTLLDGLLSLLRDLFIPGQGFMEGKADQIRNAWSNTGPAVFIDSVDTVGEALVIGSPGNNCEGPNLSFTNPVGGGNVSVNPMSSCGSEMGTLASIVKTALTVGVYVGGFLVALRIVAAAFGVQLNIGRGGDDS